MRLRLRLHAITITADRRRECVRRSPQNVASQSFLLFSTFSVRRLLYRIYE